MNEHKRPAGVYGLRDPHIGSIRYVGCSLDIWNRYDGHLYCSFGMKRGWIEELRGVGSKPELVILEDMPALRDLPYAGLPETVYLKDLERYQLLKNTILNAEKKHIKAQFLAGGCDLNCERWLTHFRHEWQKTRVGGACEEPNALPPTHLRLEDAVVGGIGSVGSGKKTQVA